MRRFVAIRLLPLSLVPVALAVPFVAAEHAMYERRYLDREALSAPDVDRPQVRRASAYRDRIPTLVYHGINDRDDEYSVTREQFARHMAALDAAGYHAVSAAQYEAFIRGEPVELPSRPILITFDDGFIDSFRGADAVLERHGLKATMFAIAEQTVEGSPTYLSPDELRSMAASERWDVRFHAGRGHRHLETGPPFYAGLLPGETIEQFGERVAEDLDTGLADLAEIVPDAELGHLFAVPFSDYGQRSDVRIATAAAHAMLGRFDALFVQSADVTPVRRGQRGILTRLEPTTTPDALLRALREGLKER